MAAIPAGGSLVATTDYYRSQFSVCLSVPPPTPRSVHFPSPLFAYPTAAHIAVCVGWGALHVVCQCFVVAVALYRISMIIMRLSSQFPLSLQGASARLLAAALVAVRSTAARSSLITQVGSAFRLVLDDVTCIAEHEMSRLAAVPSIATRRKESL